jgi:hypothetical protein
MPVMKTPSGKFPETIRKAYTTVMTGEGRVLPIVESVGRRVLRQIDPQSIEGRSLLGKGKVAIWSDRGRGARRRLSPERGDP